MADLARCVARSAVRFARLIATTFRVSTLVVAATAAYAMVAPLLGAVGVPFAGSGISSALAQTAQTITFGALAGKTYGAAPFTVSAMALSQSQRENC